MMNYTWNAIVDFLLDIMSCALNTPFYICPLSCLHCGTLFSFCFLVCLQFAGGLDSETLCAFEEIRQRVPGHLGGSQELLAGIASS